MDKAAHARRITAMLNTNGCTPAEAQGRLAKARQVAEREGLLSQFPQLRTPEEQAAAKAAAAKAKAQAGARATAANSGFGDFSSIEINGVTVDLQNLSGAGLEVLAALLQKQQQQQTAQRYHAQRRQGYKRDLSQYLKDLEKEEDAERAAYFRACQGLWARLAVVVSLLAVALLVNRACGGPLAFVGLAAGMGLTSSALTGMYWLDVSDRWRSRQRHFAFEQRMARYRP